MRKRHSQLLGLVIILLLVPFALLPAQAQAEPEADAWTSYPIPQKGEEGGWVLTGGGTGVTAICVAFDGTIYAATEETSGSPLDGYNLFKSTDDGYTWIPLWEIPTSDKPSGATTASKIIALLLPRWEETDILYLATQYNVYKSTDGGEDFTSVAGKPGGAGTDGLEITALDVTVYEGGYVVVVGIADISSTTLSSDINSVTVNIPVVSTAGFKTAGIIKIENELISYSGKDATYFTGCDRGYRGTDATSHDSGEVVDSLWNGEYGGAYFYDESEIFTSWADLRVGNAPAGTRYDVLDVAFSPNFADDMQVVALVTDEAETIVTTKLDYLDWGATIGDATLDFPSIGGCLAFPADYDSSDIEDKYIQYVGLDIDGVAGAIYIVMGYETPDSSEVLPMFIPDSTKAIHSIAVAGAAYDATIVAGLTDGGVLGSRTPPPGTNTFVALGGFYSTGYVVYAGTSGTNGGFARSVDSGDTFAQTAFICDDLQTIIDLAVSPNYATDSTIYMITEGNSTNSILWRTTNSGTTWDAVLTEGQVITLLEFDKVAISPLFASDTTVFICESRAAPNIWRSTDNGFHFSPLPSKSTTGTINAWAIVNNEEILVGDSLGDFYKTTDDRRIWRPAVATGLSSFSSMALSPDYEDDNTILAGGDGGEVYLSTDDGETWEALAGTGLMKSTVVAFDPNYASNKTVYAADCGADGAEAGVMRYVVDTSTEWERIDDTSPTRIEEIGASTSADIRGMVAADDGDGLSTLYVTDPDPVVPRVIGTTAAEGGVARCLNPTAPLSPAIEAPVFEIVNTDLAAEIELSGLWHAEGSHTLWSIDTNPAPDVLYAYEDTLTLSPELASPHDGACSGRGTSSEVSWSSISSASSYNLWYDIFPSFKQSPAQIYSEVANTRISGLDIGTTYYWRVRVGEAGDSTCVPGTTITFGAPALSRFSTSWSFTTALGGAQWSPFGTATGVAPPPGATNVPIRPSFAWNSAEGATGYEFVLSRDSEFSDVVIALTDADALSTTVWACSQDLDYDTTYFWRVRAISATGQSGWGVGVFTTGAAPKTPPQPSQPSSPPAPTSQPGIPIYFWVALGIGVALVIVVLVLIVATLRARL